MLDELSEQGRRALLERSVEKSYAAGQTLWAAGDEPAGLVIVMDGKVRIIRASGGRQTVIHSGGPGSTLGEVPFFTRAKYPATAIAAEPTRCLLISYAALDHALRVDPKIAFYLLERLSGRVQNLVDKIAGMSAQSVQSRLAEFIVERAMGGSARDKGRPFSLGMTQANLAEELGTVREVVVRALRSLRQIGAIDAAGGGRYRVASLEILKRAADTDV